MLTLLGGEGMGYFNSAYEIYALMCAFATTGLPVAMMDERMTTMAASRFLNETNTRGAKRKTVIDTLSAQIILQNYMDSHKAEME